MTHRNHLGWRPLAFVGVALVAQAVPATALARPSITIKECAQATTLRATIDPKKPDAARKLKEVQRLMAICTQKAAADRGSDNPPPKKPPVSAIRRPPVNQSPAPVRPAPVRPNPPPARPAFPMPTVQQQPQQQQPQEHKVNILDLLGGLTKKKTPPPPAPAPARPAAPPAPRPAAAPAPAPAPAAPPAMTPVAFKPPAPPASTPDQRNVFGIQLGEALKLPACAPGVVNASDARAFTSTAKTKQRSVTASCAQSGPAVQTLAQRMAAAEGRPIPKGVEFALVRLSADRCPDWVSGSCTLSVALKSGVALGISFLTGENAEPEIVRLLSSKYNGSPSTHEPTACDVPAGPGVAAGRRMGNENGWRLADLDLSYDSVQGLNCGQGRVLVQTPELLDLFERAMSGDDQPKM
jgi:hypothetical protein